MTKLRIAIIGAGPAGCTLARLLQQSNAPIDVTIYEGEQSLDVRSQGGTLDLHIDTGLAAIKAAGLWDEFLRKVRFDGEAFKATDKDLRTYINFGQSGQDSSRGRPEIDRAELRSLLLSSVDASSVRWGKRLRSIDQDEQSGRFSLHFDDGTESGFDLIVGSDGAWSKVRPVLTTVTPYYTGVAGTSFSISHAERHHPEIYKLVNRGSVFSFHDNKAFMAQQMGDGSLSMSVWAAQPEDWQKTTSYDLKDPKQVKQALHEDYATWHPMIHKMIDAMDDKPPTPRSLFMLPVGHSWKHVPGITLIGDAAHLMSPFAGEGVNLAMKDALELANAIVASANSGSNPQTLSSNVQSFERNMFARSTLTMRKTEEMMNYMFKTAGAPDAVIEKWVLCAASDEVPRVVYPLFVAAVYSYFFLWRLLSWGSYRPS